MSWPFASGGQTIGVSALVGEKKAELLKAFEYWTVVDLQCHIGFGCTAERFSVFTDYTPLEVIFLLFTQSCLTLQPHGLHHARLPCPSPSPGACSNSCPLSWWCHPTISSFVVPKLEFPVLCSISLLFIYFTHSSLYLLILCPCLAHSSSALPTGNH